MARITLKGEKVYLRALEPEDLDFVYQAENDEHLWQLSSTVTPFSKDTIKQYLEHALRDIYDVKQLRLVICNQKSSQAIGMIDLFEFDPKNRRVGLGILILEKANRGLGFGAEAIQLLINYCFKHLEVHQVYAHILENNIPSIKLFEHLGFEQTSCLKDWRRDEGKFYNELIYQLINTNVH